VRCSRSRPNATCCWACTSWPSTRTLLPCQEAFVAATCCLRLSLIANRCRCVGQRARTVSALMREQSSIFQCMQPYFLPMLAYLLEVRTCSVCCVVCVVSVCRVSYVVWCRVVSCVSCVVC
jgi:hypothetical protein